jgi:hypothetical protein
MNVTLSCDVVLEVVDVSVDASVDVGVGVGVDVGVDVDVSVGVGVGVSVGDELDTMEDSELRTVTIENELKTEEVVEEVIISGVEDLWDERCVNIDVGMVVELFDTYVMDGVRDDDDDDDVDGGGDK